MGTGRGGGVIPTAVITTRGDVDLAPVLDSLPAEWPKVIWNNALRPVDMKVYGYFAALLEVDTDYVYTQADDALVDAQALVDAWTPEDADRVLLNVADGDTPWISFGGLFHRDLPREAFDLYVDEYGFDDDVLLWCEVILLNLVPWRNVDLGKTDLPCSRNDNRMEHQPTHYAEQARVRARAERLQVAA